LAPADRRLYAIRDVTATVDSLPLITASILSKKLAEGAQALVMDVKVGSGAFMTTQAQAQALGESLVRAGNGAGLPTVALLTDMDQPLGRAVGNALEVREAVEFLCGGRRDGRLTQVVLALATEALVGCGLCADGEAAQALAQRRLDDGSAAERFGRSVAALGGPADLLERPDVVLAAAPTIHPVLPAHAGVLAAMDARAMGMAVVALGGGRTRPQDGVDHRVGLTEVAGIGERVDRYRPLCLVHARSVPEAAAAADALRACVTVAEAPAAPAPVLRGRIAACPGASGGRH